MCCIVQDLEGDRRSPLRRVMSFVLGSGDVHFKYDEIN